MVWEYWYSTIKLSVLGISVSASPGSLANRLAWTWKFVIASSCAVCSASQCTGLLCKKASSAEYLVADDPNSCTDSELLIKDVMLKTSHMTKAFPGSVKFTPEAGLG